MNQLAAARQSHKDIILAKQAFLCRMSTRERKRPSQRQQNTMAKMSREMREKGREIRELQKLFRELMPDLDSPVSELDKNHIHTIISFLAANVQVFRLGYLKQQWLRKLKNLWLSQPERERLIELALNVVRGKYRGRDNPDLARLMIRIGDRNFVRELNILANREDGMVQPRARRMLDIVVNGRPDLADAKQAGESTQRKTCGFAPSNSQSVPQRRVH